MEKILVIDDEVDIREMLAFSLGKKGYEVMTAHDGPAGIDIVKKEEIKVAIVDLKMKDMGGIEVLEHIKKARPDVEVIIATGHGSMESAIESMRKGARDYINKPFNLQALSAMIERVVEHHKLKQEVKESKEIISLYRLSQAMISEKDLGKLLDIILEIFQKELRGEGASIMLYDPELGELIVRAAAGISSEAAIGKKLKVGERLAGYVADKKEPLILDGSLKDDPRFKHLEVFDGIKSGMIIPIVAGGNIVGTMNLKRVEINEKFTEKDVKLAMIFAQQAGAAIKNAIDFENIKGLERLKSNFMTNVSHELVTPLMAIIGVFRILKGRIKRGKNRRMINIGYGNTMRLTSLIDELLVFLKIEKNLFKIDKRESDIIGLIRETTKEMELLVKEKHLDMEISMPRKIMVAMDFKKIKQVVTNLVSNSIKFTPEKGVIRIEAVVKGKDEYKGRHLAFQDKVKDLIEISVSDTGIGLDKEQVTKVFEKFYQVDSSLTRHGGLGLGLSICKEIVELHQGKIWAESAGPGEGTRMVFLLPKTED